MPEYVMPTDDELRRALDAAQRFAMKRASRPHELAEAARGAAVESVVWASKRYDPTRTGKFGGDKGFVGFALSVAYKWVHREVRRYQARQHVRPAHEEISEAVPARPDPEGSSCIPLSLLELPDDLRDAVRLFYIDRFDLRECALLLGIGRETVRARLKQAAEILGQGMPLRRRQAGNRRLLR